MATIAEPLTSLPPSQPGTHLAEFKHTFEGRANLERVDWKAAVAQRKLRSDELKKWDAMAQLERYKQIVSVDVHWGTQCTGIAPAPSQ